MPVNSNDFLSLVQQSTPIASTEIDFRNIVSRSYYGMYHGVLEMLTNQPIKLKGVGCHESLKDYLVSYDAKKNEPYDKKDLYQIKTVLEIYKTKRKRADYDLDEEIFQQEATSANSAISKLLGKCSAMKEAVESKQQSNNP